MYAAAGLSGLGNAGGDGKTGGGFPWDIVGAVALIAVLIAGMLLVLRLVSRGGMGRQSRYMRVLDRFPISRDCHILLLGVGARVVAVCVGREGGSLLCELDPAELDLKADGPAAPSARGPAPERSTFGERFWHNLRLNMRLLPKGTQPMVPPPKTRPARTGNEDTEAFAAILDAVQRQQGQSAAAGDAAQAPQSLRTGGNAAADYRAAVENMRRLAQTDRAAPAARPAPSSAPAPSGRAGDLDGDTARELLRILQERQEPSSAPKRHETPQPAHTKDASRDGAIDEILDSIAKRQSRYTSGQPGKGKDHR